ncbi:hypothetical protein NPIL_108811 [Nephila pilipes]|uniref:Uncharacterized protein n=1 Tax=Nephila pilipes TaxID=299642 RepID=A0A8X6Q9K0_NEPPI|nr:hypothetical protein NPIL_108811 [Nephila pilipes]
MPQRSILPARWWHSEALRPRFCVSFGQDQRFTTSYRWIATTLDCLIVSSRILFKSQMGDFGSLLSRNLVQSSSSFCLHELVVIAPFESIIKMGFLSEDVGSALRYKDEDYTPDLH